MTDSIQSAFVEFERTAVRVPATEVASAQLLHPQIRAVVEAGIPRLVDTFLAGSFARKTHAINIKDIDFVAVLEEPDGRFAASATYTLAKVAEVAQDHEQVIAAEPRVRAVQLTLRDSPFTFDVVPARQPDKGDGLVRPAENPL